MGRIEQYSQFKSEPIDDGNLASVAWSTGKWRNFVSQPDINFNLPNDIQSSVAMLGAVQFGFNTPALTPQATVNDEFSRGASLSYPNGIDPNPARWEILSLSTYLKENTSSFSSGILESRVETDAPGGAENIMRHRNPPFEGDFTFYYYSQNDAGDDEHEFGFRIVDSVTGEMWRCGMQLIGSTRTDFSYYDGFSWTQLQSTGRSSGTFYYNIYRSGADIWAKADSATYNIAPAGSTNPMYLEMYHRTTRNFAQTGRFNFIRKTA